MARSDGTPPRRVTIDDPLLADFVDHLRGDGSADGVYVVIRHKRRVVKVERVHLEPALGKP
ncbi:MAG: hypothetical protein HY675_25535 [Chloroflexi bacterium]|nr:hypothetical protein [Chloroflexota bacterium]